MNKIRNIKNGRIKATAERVKKIKDEQFNAISPFLIDELKQRFTPPPAPTYTTTTVTGVVEKHLITEKLVKEKAVSEEDAQSYQTWKNEVAEVQAAFNRELLDMLLLEGLKFEYDEQAREQWLKKRAFYKFTNEFENEFVEKLAYIKQVLYPNPVELLDTVARIMDTIPGVDHSEVLVARESFRDLMEG